MLLWAYTVICGFRVWEAGVCGAPPGVSQHEAGEATAHTYGACVRCMVYVYMHGVCMVYAWCMLGICTWYTALYASSLHLRLRRPRLQPEPLDLRQRLVTGNRLHDRVRACAVRLIGLYSAVLGLEFDLRH